MKSLVYRCAIVAVIAACGAPQAHAQCASCATPYAAAYAVAPAPVYQTVPAASGWYPGKYIGEWLFGGRTYATNYAPAYTAGYAPAATYTAAYAPAAYTAAYTPTYPPSYLPAAPSYVAAYPALQTLQSPAALTAACDPCTTAYRPVTMAPVATCDACSTCNAYAGVAPATYDAPLASSCPSCEAQATYDAPLAPATAPPAGLYPEPQPAVPGDTPEGDRSLLNKPEVNAADSAEEAATNSTYFQPPQLYNPKDRVTSRTNGVPVHRAVYQAPVKRHKQIGASGWGPAK